MNKLYHRSIYWHDSFNADISNLLSKPYKYSHHALERLHEPNRSHKIGMDELDLAIDKVRTHTRDFSRGRFRLSRLKMFEHLNVKSIMVEL